MVLQLVVFLSSGAPRAPQGPEIVLVGGGRGGLDNVRVLTLPTAECFAALIDDVVTRYYYI